MKSSDLDITSSVDECKLLLSNTIDTTGAYTNKFHIL